MLITQTELLNRENWTKKALELFYPMPHETKQLRYNRVCKLYLLDTICSIELTPEFKQFAESNKKRKQGAKAATDKKRVGLITYVKLLKIDVPEYGQEELLNRAIREYNQRQFDTGDCNLCNTESEPTFLNRISINYLRHHLTTGYDKQLTKMFGKVGKTEAYSILKKRVNDEIFKKYPYLKETL